MIFTHCCKNVIMHKFSIFRKRYSGVHFTLGSLKFKLYVSFFLSPDQFTRGKGTYFKVLMPDYYCYILKWPLLPPKGSRIYVYSERLKCSIHSEAQGAFEV